MHFLANENFPLESVRSLRTAGHDVAAVIEDSRGAKDHEVLRFVPFTPQEPAEIVLQLLTIKGLVLEGRFTVVERTQIRQRPFLRSTHNPAI
jgi:hypothetical protein